MNILYGVQATGNGHISRARAMAKHFTRLGINVDYLFSGRERSQFFDMEEFGNWQLRRGLTFRHNAGKLSVLDTLKHNSLREFWRDVRALDVNAYDLVMTDYEPITAWACKRAGRDILGMGHQYAFNFPIPRAPSDWMSSLIMKHFAPVTLGLGLHWHHFDHPILPPIAETASTQDPIDPNKIIVYLGFESPDDVIALLEPFENYLFVYYGPFPQYESRGHIQLKPLSREGFKHDLATAGGVIANAGFELSSEAIQLGKKLLIKPLKGQVEQHSNAVALEKLRLGMTMESLDAEILSTWLKHWQSRKVVYPDVAGAITTWISQGKWKDPRERDALVKSLWRDTLAPDVEYFSENLVPGL